MSEPGTIQPSSDKPEIVTIPRITEELRLNIEKIIRQAAEGKARRSAALCMHLSVGHCREDWRAACHECHRLILSDAGLK